MHESKGDSDSRLYRKSNVAPPLPSYLGHGLIDIRHCLVVNVQASRENRRVECDIAAVMLLDIVLLDRSISVPTSVVLPDTSATLM